VYEYFHEVGPYISFSVKMHSKVPMGIIPLGFNPVNQTLFKGKNP
jgi:hypothetical protein